MGMDWRSLTWWEYQIALAGWNAQHAADGDDAAAPKDFSRLKRALEAHTVH